MRDDALFKESDLARSCPDGILPFECNDMKTLLSGTLWNRALPKTDDLTMIRIKLHGRLMTIPGHLRIDVNDGQRVRLS